MSDGSLFVQTDGLRSYSRIHADVVAGLAQLTGSAGPGAAAVETSHGSIAAAVSVALSDLLVVRDGTIQTTANTGTALSERLLRAALAYEQGDQQAAGTLQQAGGAVGDGAGGGQADDTAAGRVPEQPLQDDTPSPRDV